MRLSHSFLVSPRLNLKIFHLLRSVPSNRSKHFFIQCKKYATFERNRSTFQRYVFLAWKVFDFPSRRVYIRPLKGNKSPTVNRISDIQNDTSKNDIFNVSYRSLTLTFWDVDLSIRMLKMWPGKRIEIIYKQGNINLFLCSILKFFLCIKRVFLTCEHFETYSIFHINTRFKTLTSSIYFFLTKSFWC